MEEQLQRLKEAYLKKEIIGGVKEYLKKIGELQKTVMNELKKVRKEKALTNAEEDDEENVENELNEESNDNDPRGRYEELVDIGFGQRSIQGPSRPIHERAIGVTAAAAASALNSAENYDIKGKSCLKCEGKFQAGKKIKTKVVQCVICKGFVHECKKDCKVDISQGNENYKCPICLEFAIEETQSEEPQTEENETEADAEVAIEETHTEEDETEVDTEVAIGETQTEEDETEADVINYIDELMVKLVCSEESAEMFSLLEKIENIPVNLAILQESGAGKIMRRRIMRKVANYDTEDYLVVGLRAKKILNKWKKIVLESPEATEEEVVESSKTTEEMVDKTTEATAVESNEETPVSGETYSACDICGRELNVKSLKRHKRNVHGPSIDVDNSLSPPMKRLRRRGN